MAHAGSSPRMRGKLWNVTQITGFGGLIPAHAGKTLSFLDAYSEALAHPRACGENPEAR